MLSTHCGYCESRSHMSPRWGRTDQRTSRLRLAATCDNCGEISVGVGTHPDMASTSDVNYITRYGNESSDLRWLPRKGDSPAVEDVPDSIARAAREAYSSASIGNHMAAILMARTVIEATAKEKGITTGNLASKINALRDGQFIRPAIADEAHEVRFAGNDMAHGDIDIAPDETDAEEILALMAEVLAEVFQGPARMARVRAKREGATP